MLPRKRNMYLLVLLILAVIKTSDQYSSGAPPMACIDQTPRHGDIQPQSSVPPYIITTSATQVKLGDTLGVTIGSPIGAPVPIGGFILQARQKQDPEKIFGKFLTVPIPGSTHIISCRGDNDTVTHSNPDPKPALTFTWQAPVDFLGEVEFRATVAQSYAMFWKDVESDPVEVVTPETIITTPAAVTTTQRTTQAPPVIMESKPKPISQPLDLIYQGCADTKLCFGAPENCIEKGNCKAVVTVFVVGDAYTFEIQGSGNPKYVAAGLSMDTKMGDDSVMECVRNDNGRVSPFTSWSYPKVEPYINRTDSPQDIMKMLGSSVIDGKLYCKFTRDTVSVVKGHTFDLANNKYNLMVVAGAGMKDANRVGFHNLVFAASGQPLALSTVGAAAGSSKLLLKLHGCFMVLAWLAAASVGILFARYYKQTWVGKKIAGVDVWFGNHRTLMQLTWLLTVVGFVLILVEVGGWADTGENPHAITGIITVVLCFIQPIGAFFRPHPGTKKRPIFNWLHWGIGNVAHILGIVTIFMAVYLPKAELPSWTVFILAAFVVFHVLMHIGLTLTVCVSDTRIGNGRVNSFPMKDMLGQPRSVTQVDTSLDAPFSSFRKLILGVYVTVIILFAIAMVCLIALAPIVETYNAVMGN